MSTGRSLRRENVNTMNLEAAQKRAEYVHYGLTDVMSVFSTSRSFASMVEARRCRIKGEGAAADDLRNALVRDFGSDLAKLFSVALRLLPAGEHESATFAFLDTQVKLVKGDDGKLSVVVGRGEEATTLKLDYGVEGLIDRFVGLAIAGRDAIVELQKLGLELPPQINCFIQSLVRFSNTISEINTIVNQTRALMAQSAKLQVPDQQNRDELDLMGKIFDSYTSEDGQKMIHYELDMGGRKVFIPEEAQKPDDLKLPAYLMLLQSDVFGGDQKITAPMFQDGGTYTESVKNRLTYSPNTLEAATKLVETFVWHCDTEHSEYYTSEADNARVALAQLTAALRAAGDNADAKSAAINQFAVAFASQQATALQIMTSHFAANYRDTPPTAFSGAITDILFDNFVAMSDAIGGDRDTFITDARNIAVGELHANIWSFTPNLLAVPSIVSAIRKDANSVGGDNSYQIDIGV